jgi:cell division protein ZapA
MPVEAMGQVAVNVNGRSYRFDCGDGEEARLKELAAYVKGRIDTLAREYGTVGDERLMLMAALLITDELFDARAAAAEKAGANGQARAQAAERREQEAIRADLRRKVAAGVEP